MKKVTVKLCLSLAALLLASSFAGAQTSVIPQVVDGGAWSTTIVITNTSASPTAGGLTFQEETGNGATGPWQPSFLEVNTTNPQNFTLQGGSTLFLHTPGNAPAAAIGWGLLTQTSGDPGALAAYAIFTQRVPSRTDQDGTAPASATSNRVLIPFDNTHGAVTSIAIANPTSSSESINVGVRTSVSSSQPPTFVLPPQGHTSFDFPTLFPVTVGQSGLAELYTSTGSISVIALRFSNGAFTTSPVYGVTGPPFIASTAAHASLLRKIITGELAANEQNATGGIFPFQLVR